MPVTLIHMETGVEEPIHTLRLGRFAQMPEHAMHRVAPEDYLLIWTLAGRGFAETEGQRHTIGPGSLLTFAKGCEHRYGSDRRAPWEILWVHFDGPRAAEIFAELRQPDAGPVRSLPDEPVLRHRFHELIATHGSGGATHQRLADRLAWALLGLIAHRVVMPAIVQAGLQPIAAVQSHVQRHLAEPLDVATLAKVAHRSPRHLNRLMTEALGCSPMQYVIDQRMARAATLLEQTDLPIQRVAEAVGYDDPFHFSRLFTRRMGRSPRQYRQRPLT